MLSVKTVEKEMKSVGWENLSVLELLFLCGSEISVLLKGDICARLPCLLTSNSDWELAPDALPIIRQQKQWRRWWCLGGGGGLLVEKVRPANRAASARDGGELRTFRDDYTGQ